MEEKEVRSVEYQTKYQAEKDKSEIFAYINKKSEANRDRIEQIDDRLSEKVSAMERKLDQNTFQMGSLEKNIIQLDGTMKEMNKNIVDHSSMFMGFDTRLGNTESRLDTKTESELARRKDFLQLIGIVIPALIGAGGFGSWFGPIIIEMLSKK